MRFDSNRAKWYLQLIGPCSVKTLLALAFGRSRPKSVLFFTQHKSASTFVTQILMSLSDNCKPLKHVNYGNILSDVGCFLKFGDRFHSESDWYYQYAQSLFKKNGYVYGPFRYPFFIPNWDLFKKIIFLRDPRDSLISRYYSFGFSHGVPMDCESKKVFLDERSKIHDEAIDDYCIRMASEWSKPMLSEYIKMISLSIEKPLVITYEQYVDCPLDIIKQIFSYCGAAHSDELADRLACEAVPVSASINIKSHKRSGRKSQYVTELQPQTVLKIEEILRDEMNYFGWVHSK